MKRGSSSFTLLETMMVLVIAGFVLALITPRIGRLPAGLVVRQVRDEVQGIFSRAAIRARARGVPVELRLNPDSNRIMLSDRVYPTVAASGGGTPAAAVAEQTQFEQVYTLPSDMEWQPNADAGAVTVYHFWPDGTATGPKLEYELRRRRFRLQIIELTGQVEVRELLTGSETMP